MWYDLKKEYTVEKREDGNFYSVTLYHFTFHFKSKEDYLAFRQEWKAEYKELSKRIRKAKHALKEECRRQARTQGSEVCYDVYKEEGHLLTLQENARMMMACIEQAKQARAKEVPGEAA